MAHLSLKDVTVRWPGAATALLDGVNLEIESGEKVFLLGPNGSGKSTLLSVIAGELAPDAGTVRCDDRCLTDTDRHTWARLVAQIPQAPERALLPEQTVLENLLLAAELSADRMPWFFPKWRSRARVETLLRPHAPLWKSRLGQPVESLSGGERQLLVLLMASLRSPGVLLLDEATSALDAQVQFLAGLVLQRLIEAHRPAALLVTHNLSMALEEAHRIVVLRDGRLTEIRQDTSHWSLDGLRQALWGAGLDEAAARCEPLDAAEEVRST